MHGRARQGSLGDAGPGDEARQVARRDVQGTEARDGVDHAGHERQRPRQGDDGPVLPAPPALPGGPATASVPNDPRRCMGRLTWFVFSPRGGGPGSQWRSR